ncbi:MAG TPA: hypothetical protein VGD94_18040 [Vicinamibacterales bacterium]
MSERPMPEVNPDPHESGYAFIPVNRVTSLFASRDDARRVVEELAKLGYTGDRIEVFVGETGAERLDLSGEAHGTAVRRLRNLEALLVPETGETLRRADEELRAGGVFVAVRLDDDEGKEEVAAAFRKHRGSVIRYWSRWVVESLDQQT